MARGVRARGNSIQIDFPLMGVRCRETLKMPPTKTNLLYAERKRQAVLYDIETGKFDYLGHFPNSKKALAFASKSSHHLTVESILWDWFKKAERRCAASTLRDYKSSISYHLAPKFGSLTLDQLQASDIREWVFHLTLQLSPKRINNILTPLRRALHAAYLDEIIDRNPMDRIENLPRKTREPQPFSEIEIDKILAQLSGQSKNLIQFAFASGLRTSELIALDWQDVDLVRRSVFVHQAVVRGKKKETKTRAGRRHVYLSDKALEALASQKTITGKQSLVFTDPAKPKLPLDDQKIRKRIWRPALARANVTYREPYQTRHTFASALLSKGSNPLWVAQQMGHKDWGTIRQVYGRWIPQEHGSMGYEKV